MINGVIFYISCSQNQKKKKKKKKNKHLNEYPNYTITTTVV